MAEMSNIDSSLISDMQNHPQNSQNPPPIPAVAVEHVTPAVAPLEPVPDQPAQEAAALPSAPPPSPEPGHPEEQAPVKQESTPSTPTSSNIDEYGNPIAPPRTYTEDEVNRMVRERLARNRYSEPPQAPQQQPQSQPSAQGDDEWQSQLKNFIKQTNDEYFKEQQQQQWRQQEAQRQAEFESKFNSGMSKYNDFREVVAGKNITDGIMLAARALDNPAAFVYGAAKMHAQELDRISKIPDPYAQAAEVGRLHERMVKERRVSSQAPKPIETVKSDVPSKPFNSQPSIDQRILDYAQKKLSRR